MNYILIRELSISETTLIFTIVVATSDVSRPDYSDF